jgi:membrane-bound metal-dependent hydrolase YbcI (DUF457 family)
MPFTPYHFAPHGFVALISRKYIDLPVFILANVFIDIEVLLYHTHPYHRYAHTLLIGGLIGAVGGIAMYPLKNFFKKILNLLALDYNPTIKKMILAGILGAWFHIFTDAFCHYDVKLFWPFFDRNPFWRIIGKANVKIICLAFIAPLLAYYLIILKQKIARKNNDSKSKSQP